MKLRIMCYLLVTLFWFTGNPFASEEVGQPTETGTSVGNEETISVTGTEGTYNTFYGNNAGHSITSGQSNTFIGSYAGYSNTEGFYNTFVGRNAGRNSVIAPPTPTLPGGNTFIGCMAGYSNTSSQGNTYVGFDAGRMTQQSWNSFFGWRAGRLANGYHNCFFGLETGRDCANGHRNSFFGSKAGRSNNGSDNVFLGYNTGNSNPQNKSNKLFIDNTSTAYPLIWGDFSNDNVIIYGGFRANGTSSSSDGRWKKNIEPLKSSLKKVTKLQGVSFEWKAEEFPGRGLTEGTQIGFVAQDVEQILPELVSEDKDGFKAVSYSKLTAVLVEAVKELKDENQKQKEALEKQQNEIENLRLMINELKS